MLGGTGSDVGKSLIAAGLCRIFLQDGYHPAPFKAQNMANNSYVTPDGKELGRAQAVQAEASGLECSTDMNPVLLKPSSNSMSQVVVNGCPEGNSSARDYYRDNRRSHLREVAHEAFSRLEKLYNPIVMEGAGSIAELNLKPYDIVNMSMAEYAGAAVILVADIDRGGVFASAYGSVMLQSPEERRLIKGVIINKFRGDISLFDEGKRIMEEICGVPVLGMVPYAPDLNIDEEDSVSLEKKKRVPADGKVNIAVLELPHISNFTDFNTLERIHGINLYYSLDKDDLEKADMIIIPGTKSVASDLQCIRTLGLDNTVTEAIEKGVSVIGICGGYQMMGESIEDPDGVEGDISRMDGLGILPVTTVLRKDKTTRAVKFRFSGCCDVCHGYEIHNGVTKRHGGSPAAYKDDSDDGCMVAPGVFGTYMHGMLDNPGVIEILLRPFAGKDVLPDPLVIESRDKVYDNLADFMRRHIDINRLYEIMKSDD